MLAVLPTGFGKSLASRLLDLRFVTFVHLPFSVRSIDLFSDSLVFMKGTLCCVIQRNFKQSIHIVLFGGILSRVSQVICMSLRCV